MTTWVFLTHMTTWVGDLVWWRLSPDHWGWQIRREGIKWSCQIAQHSHAMVHGPCCSASRFSHLVRYKCIVVVDADLDHRLVRVSTSLIDTHLEHEERSESLKSIEGSVRPMLILFFVWYTLEHLQGRPIGEEHTKVVLGSARPPRTPPNLFGRCDKQ